LATLKDIPVIVAEPAAASGQKYRTAQGFSAIKDGVKASAARGVPVPITRKPAWLKAPLGSGGGYAAVRQIVREHRLATVCEEAKCPNIGECWNAGTATIMLMGEVCTRACRFCAVDTGNPRGWLDHDEPDNTARSVELMKLRYVVLTSVNRDDLDDGGAAHFAATVRAIKARNPGVAVEALTPDFQGVLADVETVVDSGLDVFAQNVETVRRLTHPVRDPRASYEQTLAVLAHARRHRPVVLTKTSLMLGLGETDAEIAATMDDLRAIGVDILTLGQYLRPTANHLPIARFVTPAEFDRYREWGLARGFRECVSGPLVRSSYRAEQALNGNNAGLDNSRLQPSPLTATVVAAPRVVEWRGRADYEPIWREMQQFTDLRTESTPDRIWMLEHPPVFTLGMNASREHLLSPGEIPVVPIDRGGQVTYHGPGQLMIYPLLDLRRAKLGVRDLVTALEQTVVDYCAAHAIEADTRADAPGVYVRGAKLASIGIRVRRGASYHGLALNVDMDLEPFSRINPCGFKDLPMTQLADLGVAASTASVAAAITPHLLRALRLE